MCRKLEALYPERYKAIEVACEKSHKYHGNIFIRCLNYALRPFAKVLYDIKLIRLTASLQLSDGDCVILTEYMDKIVRHITIAKFIHKHHSDVKILGISHLVPSKLDDQFDQIALTYWLNKIDGLITLGSSLSSYYVSHGFQKDKILTTFHYVDEYYLTKRIECNDEIKILVQGNQMRDLQLLTSVIKNNPNVIFIVCQGVVDLSSQLNFPNVQLRSFMAEDELRELMRECSISLNVMKDTIGSNVIVTSLGMGLAMICSDVGSIRDYCTHENCFFCTTMDEFTNAIGALVSDRERLNDMRMNSMVSARRYDIKSFEKELYSFVQSI